MFIPSQWKGRISGFEVNTAGMSPAEIIRFDMPDGCAYLKSVDAAYSSTTYSVKREAGVIQWLDGKLRVPHVIDCGVADNREFMVMSEIKGSHISDDKGDPEKHIAHLANCVNLMQALDITDCPFDSSVDVRLRELKYLMDSHFIAADDFYEEEWELITTSTFADPAALYQWLCDNKPNEEFVFSHGDMDANSLTDGSGYIFYDLGRAGIADKWLDIAFCVRNIRWSHQDKKYEDLFFDLLGIEPDHKKIEYFLLLDVMF